MRNQSKLKNTNATTLVLALIEANQYLQQQLRVEALEAPAQITQTEETPEPARSPSEREATRPLLEQMGLDAEKLYADSDDIVDVLESRPSDYERDSHLELVLNDTFIADETLRTLQTSNLQCRSGLCLIDIDVSDAESFDQGMLHIKIRNEQILELGRVDTITTVEEGSVRLIFRVHRTLVDIGKARQCQRSVSHPAKATLTIS